LARVPFLALFQFERTRTYKGGLYFRMNFLQDIKMCTINREATPYIYGIPTHYMVNNHSGILAVGLEPRIFHT